MNEFSSLINGGANSSDTASYQAISMSEERIQSSKDYFKPSRPLSTIQFDYEGVNVRNTANSSIDIDQEDQEDIARDEDFLAKIIRLLDLTTEVLILMSSFSFLDITSTLGSRTIVILGSPSSADSAYFNREGFLQDGH